MKGLKSSKGDTWVEVSPVCSALGTLQVDGMQMQIQMGRGHCLVEEQMCMKNLPPSLIPDISTKGNRAGRKTSVWKPSDCPSSPPHIIFPSGCLLVFPLHPFLDSGLSKDKEPSINLFCLANYFANLFAMVEKHNVNILNNDVHPHPIWLGGIWCTFHSSLYPNPFHILSHPSALHTTNKWGRKELTISCTAILCRHVLPSSKLLEGSLAAFRASLCMSAKCVPMGVWPDCVSLQGVWLVM